MPSSSVSRFFTLMIVIILTAVAFIIAAAVTSFSWPLGSNYSLPNTANTNTNYQFGRQPPGQLEISAVYNDSSCAFCYQPIQGLGVSISSLNPFTFWGKNYTDTSGTIRAKLPATQYFLQVTGPSYGINITATVESNNVTHVGIVVNKTIYSVVFFDIFDEESAAQIGNWQSLFVKVQANQTIANVSKTVTLETIRGPLGSVSLNYNGSLVPASFPLAFVLNRVDTTSATIESERLTGGYLWMQLTPKSLMNSTDVLGMQIVNYVPLYTVNITSVG